MNSIWSEKLSSQIEIMGNRCCHDNDAVISPDENEVENTEEEKEEDNKRKDENEERGNWTGKMDFILSLLG